VRRDALIAAAAARLAAAGVPDPARDARRLAAWAAGLEPAALLTRLDAEPDAAETARLETAVAGRAARRPLSHITGERLFWGRSFRVTADVLDPRPETETIVAEALARPAGRILDLGTGSGCLLVTLLAEWPGAIGTGTDISDAALAVAAGNAARHGVSARARLIRADWFAGVEGVFDLVVSNPPYIAEAEIAGLAPEVRLHEPRTALTPGPDGLAAYRAIASGLAAALSPGGRAILETGAGQAPAVAQILVAAGLDAVRVLADLDGRGRAVTALRPEISYGDRFGG